VSAVAASGVLVGDELEQLTLEVTDVAAIGQPLPDRKAPADPLVHLNAGHLELAWSEPPAQEVRFQSGPVNLMRCGGNDTVQLHARGVGH
jgi:hypothetical protein